jgi:hypothetical protein
VELVSAPFFGFLFIGEFCGWFPTENKADTNIVVALTLLYIQLQDQYVSRTVSSP